MKKFNLIIVMLITFLMFNACEKQEKGSTESTKSFFKTGYEYYWEEVEECAIANEDNLVDSVGYIHNVLMGEVLASIAPEDSVAEILIACESVWEDHYGETDFSELNVNDYIQILDKDEVEYYLDTLSAEEYIKDYFEQLIDIVSEYDATNFGLIYQNIVSFEEAIMDEYLESEIYPILIGSSIARYSLAYWHKYLSENKGTKVQNMKVPPWAWVLAGADVIGGVSGYLNSDSETRLGKILDGCIQALKVSGSCAGFMIAIDKLEEMN